MDSHSCADHCAACPSPADNLRSWLETAAESVTLAPTAMAATGGVLPSCTVEPDVHPLPGSGHPGRYQPAGEWHSNRLKSRVWSQGFKTVAGAGNFLRAGSHVHT